MNQLGFRHFVGVDGSKGMLDKANDTGLYQHLEHTLLGSEPLPAEPGTSEMDLRASSQISFNLVIVN